MDPGENFMGRSVADDMGPVAVPRHRAAAVCLDDRGRGGVAHSEAAEPELWISSVCFWHAPNGVWHDDFADFDLWLRQNIGSQT